MSGPGARLAAARDGREVFSPHRTFYGWSEEEFAIVEVRVKARGRDGKLTVGPASHGMRDRILAQGPSLAYPHGLHETRPAAVAAALGATRRDRELLEASMERARRKIMVLEGG